MNIEPMPVMTLSSSSSERSGFLEELAFLQKFSHSVSWPADIAWCPDLAARAMIPKEEGFSCASPRPYKTVVSTKLTFPLGDLA